MAVYNYQGGEVNIKIVYYGPGLSGKTTNLEFMYSKLPRETKGKMVSMKTRTDRTLFFDFFPIEVGRIGDLSVRFLLYTVPGQVYYNATRKLVLKGADAVVFVADSSPEALGDDRESLQNLEGNLNELGMTLGEIPWVMQYNKRDVPGCLSRGLLDKELNTWGVPAFEAVALKGSGVYETFEAIAKLVFGRLKGDQGARQAPVKKPAPDQVRKPVSAEVVVQGVKRIGDSETGKSETSGYAEEREEEHESVSEFVDNVLKEGAANAPAEDLSTNGGGYEEYGHVVELGDDPGRREPQTAAQESPAGVAGPEQSAAEQGFVAGAAVQEGVPAAALETEIESEAKPGRDTAAQTRIETAARAEETQRRVDAGAPRTIRVPVMLSSDEAREGVAVTVCIDLLVKDE